ncbi:MAG: hypothetical protein CM15mV66_180 [uncultured marine virus]|nr:MAG: hypothetical protein CM15mV66_180 [uncultured marine virus]
MIKHYLKQFWVEKILYSVHLQNSYVSTGERSTKNIGNLLKKNNSISVGREKQTPVH